MTEKVGGKKIVNICMTSLINGLTKVSCDSLQVCPLQLSVQISLPILDFSTQLPVLLYLSPRVSGKTMPLCLVF